MSVVFSDCCECKHFIYKKENGKRYYSCKAFPKEIPGAWMFDKKRTKDDECNNGIYFEQAKE